MYNVKNSFLLLFLKKPQITEKDQKTVVLRCISGAKCQKISDIYRIFLQCRHIQMLKFLY